MTARRRNDGGVCRAASGSVAHAWPRRAATSRYPRTRLRPDRVNAVCVVYALSQPCRWVPACAGMTVG